MPKQVRTDATRVADKKRQKGHRRNRGRGGRKTKALATLQNEIVQRFIERRNNGGYALIDPEVLKKSSKYLSAEQADLINLRLHPDSRLLDFKQLAEIVGCSHQTVSEFVETDKYFDAMQSLDVVPRRAARVEDKAWISLERNVEEGSTPDIKLAMQLAGRLDQVDNKQPIAPKELHLHVHASLESLMPKEKEIEEAEFSVEDAESRSVEGEDG